MAIFLILSKKVVHYTFEKLPIRDCFKKVDWPKNRQIIKIHNFYAIKLSFRQFCQLVSWLFAPNIIMIRLNLWIFIHSLIFGKSTFFETVSIYLDKAISLSPLKIFSPRGGSSLRLFVSIGLSGYIKKFPWSSFNLK